jgi:hypothetical protein
MKIAQRAWLLGCILFLGLTTLCTATTYSNLEEQSGWSWCSACANAGGGAILSMVQSQSSPSLDGDSTRFGLGGTTPWSHALYYKRVASNLSATHFIYDVYYYMKNPSASSGMEFSISQRNNYKWYRVDTQCSFLNGNWRVFNNATFHWVDTSIACKRPAAYTWRHLVIEGARSNGQVVFVSITEDGQKHYVNKSFYPSPLSSYGASINIHFQLNGDRYETDYQVWADKLTVTYW